MPEHRRDCIEQVGVFVDDPWGVPAGVHVAPLGSTAFEQMVIAEHTGCEAA